MSSLRPEWPGDGARRAPEPPRHRLPGDRVRGEPGSSPDQRSGYERQPYGQQPYGQQPYEQQPYEQRPHEQRPHEQQPYEQQPHAQRVPRINPVAIASLLCGIALILDLLGSLGSILVAVPAFICGGIALWQINTRRERGQGIAIAGLGLGLIGILFVVVLG